METSAVPTYEDATSDAHRPGHESTWEQTRNGRVCTLCGHLERAVSDAEKLRQIRELLDSRGLPDDHAWALTANSKIRAILDSTEQTGT